jgi:hypothetical protein
MSVGAASTREAYFVGRRTLWGRRGGRVVGGIYLWTAGIHLGIVAAGPSFYRHFADHALLGVVRTGWADVFMAAPAMWGLCLVVAETVLGIALLTGGRLARLAWAGVIAFHVLLMLFGAGFWAWSLPALAVLVPLAAMDRAQTDSREGGR